MLIPSYNESEDGSLLSMYSIILNHNKVNQETLKRSFRYYQLALISHNEGGAQCLHNATMKTGVRGAAERFTRGEEGRGCCLSHFLPVS